MKNLNCVANPCPILLNATCVFYTGVNLLYTGITTNDNLQTALEKIDLKFKDASIGYIFQDGVVQENPGDPVTLGGIFTQDVTISNGPYNFLVTNNLEAGAHVTTGGTSSDFVKGDGSLDNTPYQPSGSYITNLTGDGFANGPGVATFTLDNVNPTTGVFGSSTRVPVITTNSKGLITNITTVLISAVSGTGTQNYLTKWGSSPSTLDSSLIYDDGSGVMVNTTVYNNYKFDVNGSARVQTNLVVGPINAILVDTNYGLRVNTPMSGAFSTFGVFADGEIQSDSTSAAYYFRSLAKTAATTFTVGDINHFTATQSTFGVGSIVNYQFGFRVFSNMVGATINNRAFSGELPLDGTKNWNLYMSGTALNHLSGNTIIGSTSNNGSKLQVTGTTTMSDTLTVANSTLSSVLISLGVAPSTNGMFFQQAGSPISRIQTKMYSGGVETIRFDPFATAFSFISGSLGLGVSSSDGVNKLQVSGNVKATQYRLSTLNTAPANASAPGVEGEIRIDANHIYVCVATNTWKRTPISTWP
jgi:hypothetical protein